MGRGAEFAEFAELAEIHVWNKHSTRRHIGLHTLLFQIHFCDVKHIRDRARLLAENSHNLVLCLHENLAEVKDGELWVGGSEVAVVAIHQHHSEREELIKHCLPLAILQEKGEGGHFTDGNLLLLVEGCTTARTEGEMSGNVEMNEQKKGDVDGGGHERVVLGTVDHFLSISRRSTHLLPKRVGDSDR